jgi:NhaA family Na+:H+ antiporter
MTDEQRPSLLSTSPPETWRPARRAAQALSRPLERFLHVEAASGILLILAAAIALIWANSPWHGSYEGLWHTPLSISLGEWRMEHDLHFWINDLLMTVFFLLAGLEIKRELVHGALSDVRRAALPVLAAIGGMVVPAAIFIALNTGGAGIGGWGVPMATDIAFAVGILTLLGKRVHPSLRVLLLAFAIIDDVGAILVIAIFYSSGIALVGLEVAAAGLLLALIFLWIGVRPGIIFTLPLLIMWGGLLHAGVHPTIAGVVLGLVIPARSWYGPTGFMLTAQRALEEFQRRVAEGHHDHDLLAPLAEIETAQREAVSPGIRLEAALHPWVAFGIMPLFALANAGVNVRGLDFAVPGSSPVLLGVALGLLLGKPVGVLLLSWLSVRLRLSVLPQGVSWGGMVVMGFAGGIGFTMAIFISELAYRGSELLDMAKLGVLAATGAAGMIAYVGGRLILRPPSAAVAHEDLTETVAETEALWTVDGAPAT